MIRSNDAGNMGEGEEAFFSPRLCLKTNPLIFLRIRPFFDTDSNSLQFLEIGKIIFF